MSREIKFRVWSLNHKQWMDHVAVVDCSGNIASHYFSVNEDKTDFREHLAGWKKEDGVVLWFTGIKDKNNKDIYEGDIVKVTWEDNDPYGYSPEDWNEREVIITVVYDAPSFNLKKRFSNGGQSRIQNFQREVIGNIYENPELIKL